MPNPAESPTTNPDNLLNKNFRIVDVRRHPDGVILMITERVSDGRISFTLGREFEQTEGGKKVTKFTGYLSPRHASGALALLSEAIEEDLFELVQDRTNTRRRG